MSEENQDLKDQGDEMNGTDGVQRNVLLHPVVVAILAAALISIGGAAATMWRSAPLTTLEINEIKKDIKENKDTLKELNQSLIIQGRSLKESIDAQSKRINDNRAQIAVMKETLKSIEKWYSSTYKEVKDLNIQFARVEGALQQRGAITKAPKK